MSGNLSHWKHALRDQAFVNQFIFTFLLLIACAIAAPHIFNYVEGREGIVLPDSVLDLLPSIDLSVLIFTLLYILIGIGLITLAASPYRLLLGLQSYLIITLMRFITLLVVPLDPPPGLLELRDPFVDSLLYQQSITKDLFFSGHTGIIVLFAFLVPHLPSLRTVYVGCALLLGLLLLIQHAHYTIDVLAAPGFAWASIKLAGLNPKFRSINL